MAISKNSLLPDSNRYFMLSVSRYHEKRPEGFFCHDSFHDNMAYSGWLDLVYKINTILDTLGCPVSNMEQRSFQAVPDSEEGTEDKPTDKDGTGLYIDRDMNGEEEEPSDFRLYIRYRYNVSWQGQIISIGTGKAYDFASFLELAILLDYDLCSSEIDLIEQSGSRIYRLATGTYLKRFKKGSIHCVSLQEKQPFLNFFDLIQKAEGPEVQEKQGILVRGEIPDCLGVKGSRATFVIRLLFREHATWQGVICWREAGQKVNFRSFLEMLILMHQAVCGKFCEGLDEDNQEDELEKLSI